MEEIYTVHVKCRPDPAHSYPSERAYSSSTVGGLATTHIIIALLVATLTTAGYCSRHTWMGEFVSGVSLVSGALLCGLTGILASKRWYIDRNIRWFFVASIISTICSITSLSLMIFFVIKPTINHHSFMLLYFARGNFNNSSNVILPLLNSSTSDDQINIYLENNFTESYDSEAIKGSDIELLEPVNRYKRDITTEDITFQLEIYIHLLLAALVELILSMFSVKIGWKGVKNSYDKKINVNYTGTIGNNGKPIRPDILENHKNGACDPKLSHYSNVVKELYKLQKTSMLSDSVIGNRIITKIGNENQNKLSLPLPESQKEYRERIEKFLASHDNCLKD
ncbi:uncharacterized protein isoform X2 [Rhodnius prolixus]